MWLTGEATWLAVPGRVDLDLPHATPVADLVASVLESGSLTVCAQCAARRELSEGDIFPGTTIAGAASFVARPSRTTSRRSSTDAPQASWAFTPAAGVDGLGSRRGMGNGRDRHR